MTGLPRGEGVTALLAVIRIQRQPEAKPFGVMFPVYACASPIVMGFVASKFVLPKQDLPA